MSRLQRTVRTTAAVVAALICTLVPASVAWAHGTQPPPATNYHTEVTAVSPRIDGVQVRVVEAGYRLQLTNHGTQAVEVLGYEGEPFLQVRPEGVFENTNSPTPYVNETGEAGVPEWTDPAAPPSWRIISSAPVARWHDHRATHWVGAAPPAVVTTAPTQRHLIEQWSVPLRVEGAPAEITGTLEWLPPPEPGTWWAVIVLTAAIVATLGRLGRRRLVAAGVTVAAGAVAVAYATGRVLDAGATNPGHLLSGLVTSQPWSTLAGLGALAAGGHVLWRAARRQEHTDVVDFLLGLAGTCLAIFAGLAHAAVLTRSVAAVPVDPVWARTAIAMVIGGGAGIATAAILRLRATAHDQAATAQATADATANP